MILFPSILPNFKSELLPGTPQAPSLLQDVHKMPATCRFHTFLLGRRTHYSLLGGLQKVVIAFSRKSEGRSCQVRTHSANATRLFHLQFTADRHCLLQATICPIFSFPKFHSIQNVGHLYFYKLLFMQNDMITVNICWDQLPQ